MQTAPGTVLEDLFMQAPAFIAVLQGPDMVFQLANPLYMQLVGEDRDIIGKPLAEALPEVKEQGFIELIENIYQTGEPYLGTELPVMLDRNGDGQMERLFLNFVYQPIKDNDGNVTGIFAHGVDITEQVLSRKRTELLNKVLEKVSSGDTLENTLEYLVRQIEALSSDGMRASILLVDGNKKRLIHGAAPSLPNTYNKAIHGVEIGPMVGSCGTAAYTKKPVVVTDIANDPRWVNFKDLALDHGLKSCWSIPILSSEKEVLGTFAMYYDIQKSPSEKDQHIIQFVSRTASVAIERKRAEEALRKNAELFKKYAEAMPQMAFIADTEGNITYYNQQWYDYIQGVNNTEGWGWKDQPIHHPEDLEHTIEVWTHSIKTGEPYEIEYRLRRHDGAYRWHLGRAVPVRNDKGEIEMWLGTNTDIENQKNAHHYLEKEVSERTRELKEANKELARSNNDLEQFAYVASHDLKEPIRMVSNYTTLLEKKYADLFNAEALEYMDFITEGVSRMQLLIDDLLSYSRIAHNDQTFAEVDCNRILQGVLANLEPLIGRERAIIRWPNLPIVVGVRHQLGQLFQNFLENAIKFRSEEKQPEIDISVEDRGSEWLFMIADNGIGISPEYYEKVFVIFRRLHTKDRYPGTGIGLALCKKIVELHGGKIWIEPTAGGGTTFLFTIAK